MLKRKPYIYMSLLIICAAILLTNCEKKPPPFECTDPIGCVNIAPGEPVRIGILQVLSGEVANIGLESLRSIELAAADRGGKLLDHPIELQEEDSLCSGEGGTTAALKITADPQILAVIGTTCSGSGITAAKVISDSGLVMVSSSNTSPSLTSIGGKQGPDWQPGYFRTAHNDTVQGRAAATFAFRELGIKKAATIDDGDAYTRGLASVFAQVFEELGGEPVLKTAINKGDTDMEPVLDSIVKSGAELVFFPIFHPEADLVVMQARKKESFGNIILISAEAARDKAFIETVSSSGVGMHFVAPDTPGGPAYDAFLSNYKKKFGEDPITPYHAPSYDAANIIFDIIEKTAVKEENGTLHIGRGALRDAMTATSGYQGLTGSLACDKFGDCSAARFTVVRLDDPAAGFAGLTANVVYTFDPKQ